MAIGSGEDRVVEHQVLRAGLGEDFDAALLRLAHHAGAGARGHVDHVEGAAGHLAPGNGALDGLVLGELWARHRVQLSSVL